MALQFCKQVNDAVHGTIGLTQVEVDIISSPAFQRLHNVKQLGLGALVYPGANYSRFAHSIGACHVMGAMLGAISRNSNKEFDDREIQLYRLGGLLHDLGHFPFSHTFENVIGDFYKSRTMLVGGESPEDDSDPPVYDHETMGRKIIEGDRQLNSILDRHKYTSDEVRGIFSSEQPGVLTPLISSDLDCDRLDYLMRTAHHAGLPYGDVDVPYIISQLALDSKGNPCLTRKALRAADHFLISRYFDYTQVAFHKTVVALELALESVIRRMLERGRLDCSAKTMRELVENGTWASFDDQFITNLMRSELDAVQADDRERTYGNYLQSVLSRQPPKMVMAYEVVQARDHERDFQGHVQHVREKIDKWAGHFGIDKSLWLVWTRSLSLTKIGSDVPIESVGDDEVEEEARTQLIWVKGAKRGKPEDAERLISLPSTLVHTLSRRKFFGIRVYVNFCNFEGNAIAKRHEISARIAADLPFLS